MKKLLLFTILSIFTISAIAQETKQSKSEIANLIGKDGSFLIKDYNPVGKVITLNSFYINAKDVVNFKTVLLTDIITKRKWGGLLIEAEYNNPKSSSDKFTGVLDLDEIKVCIKVLTYIKDSIIANIPENHKECIFTSKDYVKIGCVTNLTKKGEREWLIFLNPKSYIDRSVKTFDISKLGEMIFIFRRAIVDIEDMITNE